MEQNAEKHKIRVTNWGRNRLRHMRKFMDEYHYNHKKRICFTHRVDASLCHCFGSNQISVSEKIRIPSKHDKKGWDRLSKFINETGDCFDMEIKIIEVPISNIPDKNERLLIRLTGKGRNHSYYNGVDIKLK